MKTTDALLNPPPDDPVVRLQIPQAKLLELMKAGLLCASDMKCLDCESKRCLWKLALKAGAFRMDRA